MFTKINFKNVLNFILFVIIFSVFFIYPIWKLSKTFKNLFQNVQETEVNTSDEILNVLEKEISKFLH